MRIAHTYSITIQNGLTHQNWPAPGLPYGHKSAGHCFVLFLKQKCFKQLFLNLADVIMLVFTQVHCNLYQISLIPRPGYEANTPNLAEFCLPSKLYILQNSMVILTNKNGYLSCTFVLSTLGTEQRYKECARCVGYHPGGTER